MKLLQIKFLKMVKHRKLLWIVVCLKNVFRIISNSSLNQFLAKKNSSYNKVIPFFCEPIRRNIHMKWLCTFNFHYQTTVKITKRVWALRHNGPLRHKRHSSNESNAFFVLRGKRICRLDTKFRGLASRLYEGVLSKGWNTEKPVLAIG